MIDVTVDDKRVLVEVDMRSYHLTDQHTIIDFLMDLIEHVKYSGETVSLYKAIGHQKVILKDWH